MPDSGELTTTELLAHWTEQEGTAPGVSIERDIVKMAVFERHHGTGYNGIGFLGGYDLRLKGVMPLELYPQKYR